MQLFVKTKSYNYFAVFQYTKIIRDFSQTWLPYYINLSELLSITPEIVRKPLQKVDS